MSAPGKERRDARVERPRFALRTIRNGRVRILGDWYEPTREPCPPRFDGMRAAFGLYWGLPDWGGYDERGLLNGVSLWGSEKAYRADDSDTDWPGPFCEDNTFKWEWWKRVPTSAHPDSFSVGCAPSPAPPQADQ